MQRVYTSWRNNLSKYITNELLSLLVEGIQENGGSIISLNMVTVFVPPGNLERIIMYEDNECYKAIKKFLNGKENCLGKWIKDL